MRSLAPPLACSSLTAPPAVTEYLSGGSLFDLLHPRTSSPGVPPRPRLALARVLRYAEGVCSGMAYLHSHGVIHRDLKSGNLLLAAQDVIKVGDFGVSRRLGSRAESMTAETGTYRWMAVRGAMRRGASEHSLALRALPARGDPAQPL